MSASSTSSNSQAKVWFVGAGPGAPDLITVRGQRLLAEADMVIWAGSLVNPALLDCCPAGCEMHDSSRLTLEQVIDLIVGAWQKGRSVVRLHTGDPSIYGAIREQMDRLTELGIPFEVVPGVSSMSAAAASVHAELTVPGVSQTVIVTRHEGRTPVPPGEAMASLAAHGSTMVVFLSASLAREVQDDLLRGGLDLKTPVALVYKATWPDERVVRCTVGTLAETAHAEGIDHTALMLVGEAFADGSVAGGERSRLYDPGFSTGYRDACLRADGDPRPDARAEDVGGEREWPGPKDTAGEVLR